MHTFAWKKTLMLALVAGAALSRPAFAESYSFTQLTSGATIAPVATLSITNVTGGAQFTLTGAFGWLGSSAFLGDIWFNGPAGTVTNISGNAFKNNGTPAYDPQTNAGYQFTWDANYPTSNSSNSDRFLATDYSTWQILGNGITSASFGRPMMVHVQGLADGSSIKVLSPIPEPEAYAMFLAGLGLMGFIARRRRTA